MATRRTPYDWQVRAAERSATENLIIFAETGSGKTLVACLAMERALSRGKVAFIVPTSRILAHQQFERIQEFMEERHKVVEVTGYTAGSWGEREWRDCRERYEVFVGTADLFRNAIVDHGFLSLEDFSLIVVDECHRVTGDSGAAEIMLRLHHSASQGRRRPSATTRVLGLTATLTGKQAKTRQDFQAARQSLIDALQATIDVCAGVAPRPQPVFKRLDTGAPPAEEGGDLAAELCQHIWDSIQPLCSRRHSEKLFGRLVRSLGVILGDLGKDAFAWAVEHSVVAQVEGRIDNAEAMLERRKEAEWLKRDLEGLRRALQTSLESIRQRLARSTGQRDVSEKVRLMVQQLNLDFGTQLRDGRCCGMIFVNEIALATPLAWLLQKLLGQVVEVASGVQSMREAERNLAFHRFRTGQSRLMVCTACAEEGIDVAACAFVVRFSAFATTREHVQGAGRARAPQAIIYYMANHPAEECQRADAMRQVAADASLPGPSAAQPELGAGMQVIPRRHPYVVPSTGAEASVSNAKRLLHTYVDQVTRGEAALNLPGKKTQTSDEDDGVVCLFMDAGAPIGLGLILPGLGGGCLLTLADVHSFWGEAGPLLNAPQDQLIAFVAVLVLHAQSWLDSHNQVSRQVLRQAAWPVDLKRVSRFSLKPGWYPPGILGGLEARDAGGAPPPSKIRRDGHREHVSSGAEQVRLDVARLRPDDIHNTQKTVNQTFSNGNSVMDAMVSLVQGKSEIEDFPKIRVAMDSVSRQWFSADNRRCFVYKVVCPLLGRDFVEVDVINWTSEFKSKLDQTARLGDVWEVTEETITRVREQVRMRTRCLEAGASSCLTSCAPALAANHVSQEDAIFQNLQRAGVGRLSAAALLKPRMAQEGPRDDRMQAPSDSGLLPEQQGRSSACRFAGGDDQVLAAPALSLLRDSGGEDEVPAVPALRVLWGSGSAAAPEAAASGSEALQEARDGRAELPLLQASKQPRLGPPGVAGCSGEADVARDAPGHVSTPLGHLAAAPGSAPGAVDKILRAFGNLAAPQAARAGQSALQEQRPRGEAPAQAQASSQQCHHPPRPEGEQDQVLDLIRRSLASQAAGDARALQQDPISMLNLALQGSYRPRSGEARPLSFTVEVRGEGFQCCVELCGLTFSGDVFPSKQLAKRSAAAKAVNSLTETTSFAHPS